MARAIHDALFEESPRDRYLVVPRQVEAGWTIAKAVDEMLVLNAGHEHSYTRAEIDAMWLYSSGRKSRDDPEDEAELMTFLQAWMEKQAQKED